MKAWSLCDLHEGYAMGEVDGNLPDFPKGLYTEGENSEEEFCSWCDQPNYGDSPLGIWYECKYNTFDMESNGGFDVVEGEFESFREAQTHLLEVLSKKIETETQKLLDSDKEQSLRTNYADADYAIGNLSSYVEAYQQVRNWEGNDSSKIWEIESDEAQYGIELIKVD